MVVMKGFYPLTCSHTSAPRHAALSSLTSIVNSPARYQQLACRYASGLALARRLAAAFCRAASARSAGVFFRGGGGWLSPRAVRFLGGGGAPFAAALAAPPPPPPPPRCFLRALRGGDAGAAARVARWSGVWAPASAAGGGGGDRGGEEPVG